MDITIHNRKISSRLTNDEENAWHLKDALFLLEYLHIKGYIVLGGDILDTNLNHTYDSWYYNVDLLRTLEKNAEESYNLAKEYLTRYMKMNGKDYYAVIVVRQKGVN